MHLHQRNRSARTTRTATGLLMALMLCCSLFLSHARAGEVGAQEREDNVFELGEIVVTEKRPAAESVATVTERTQKDFQTWLSQGENRNGQPGSGKR